MNYKGKDLSDIAQIVRDRATKAATLRINTDEKWEIYGGLSVETIDKTKPLLTGEGSGVFNLDVSRKVRSYFLLLTESRRGIIAESHLPMEGGFNFRDLGGLRNKEGRHVKWGKLIRSDDLSRLTDSDLTYLSSLPLTTIVDFRSEEEVEAAPDHVPGSMKMYCKLSMNPGNMSDSGNIFNALSRGVDMLMMEMYIDLVSSPATTACYKEFFSLLQDETNTPLLFHCTAGKDRTGIGTALILYALNVAEDVIMQNYLESNLYLEEKYAEYIKDYPQLKSLFEVKPQYLETGIGKIKSDYGSVEDYLIEVMNVDIQRFRDLYLD